MNNLINLLKSINQYIISSLKRTYVIPISLGLVFLIASFATRLFLVIASQEETTFLTFLLIFIFGFIYDITVAIWGLIPLFIYFTWIPSHWHQSITHRKITGIFFIVGFLLLLAIPFVEYFFWLEYKARLNFVAMDYLVYPIEVIGFIWESYPVLPIAFLIILLIFALIFILKRLGWIQAYMELPPPKKRPKQKITFKILTFCAISLLIAFYIRIPTFFSHIQEELTHNGPFSLSKTVYFCMRDYNYSYMTLPPEQMQQRMQRLTYAPNKTYLTEKPEFLGFWHKVNAVGPEKYPNVILVVMESFDAKYLKHFGNQNNLTPVMDGLIPNSIFFDRFYASAIRTVGGLESILTSRPTLAKFSLLKRPYNAEVSTLATIFNSKGYHSAYIYPGDSNFDNQKEFFTLNGFDVLDIKDLLPETKTGITLPSADKNIFKTTWGVCDETLFDWIIDHADNQHQQNKPFFAMTLTCSNHIPFEFPNQKVSGKNKTAEGAVQYADYAIGQLLEKAKSKPWFQNTIFVFVADHCTHKSDSENDLSPQNFHIPFLIYAPNQQLLSPRIISTIGSQTDLAPTLFSALNWSYCSEFLGQDLLTTSKENGRALLATFKTLGLYRNDIVTSLLPVMYKEKGYEIQKVENGRTTTNIDKLNPIILSQLIDNQAYYQLAEEYYMQKLMLQKRNSPFFILDLFDSTTEQKVNQNHPSSTDNTSNRN